MQNAARRRIIVSITGATGAIYGVRLLEELRRQGGVETHLVISKAGFLSAATELDLGKSELESLGDVAYSEGHHDHVNQWIYQRLFWDPHIH